LNFAVAERDLDALFLLEGPQIYAAGDSQFCCWLSTYLL
jgi:hypothetical protein